MLDRSAKLFQFDDEAGDCSDKQLGHVDISLGH